MDERRWNIFARVLTDILQTHGWTLGYLDDRGVVYNREKVRRLQNSLKQPGRLTTLNPEELERLKALLPLSPADQKVLDSALLATAVEMMMMDRLAPDTALEVSEKVFAILKNAAPIPHVRAGLIIDDLEETLSAQIEVLIDRAHLFIHVARAARTDLARQINAEEALDIVARIRSLLARHAEGGLADSEQIDPADLQRWQAETQDIERLAQTLYAARPDRDSADE